MESTNFNNSNFTHNIGFLNENISPKKFEEYDNFYTIIHKIRLIDINTLNYHPGKPVEDDQKQSIYIKHVYRIVYGHFIEDDIYTFAYKNVWMGKPQMHDTIHKCNIDDLLKPNVDEEYYRFYTFSEINAIRDYYVNNSPLIPYEKSDTNKSNVDLNS